ncbi:MAG: extracellular solute-binding protein [Lachnospiraceae bacterium]|nr:extracellular solute-binding protein [Lachnospiraceae bacterium]
MNMLKRTIAFGMCASMVAGLGVTAFAEEITIPEETRTITIGTWYDHYYDSTHEDIYANPDVADEETAQIQFDHLKAIEEKYNVKIEYVNLTWDGVIESINTSIMAGQPDCDIYEVDLQFGVPAALNGYAVDLKTVLSEDNDLFNEQKYMFYTDLNNGQANVFNAVLKSNLLGGYPLGYNKDMIADAGLEDPQELWANGEWTWDKFLEYCKVLTADNDGDGVTDVYGYGGWWTSMLDGFLLSNGATIASGAEQTLTSPETGEVLDFINTLYNVEKVARPWNSDDWDINNSCYKDGEICFFIAPAWTITPDELTFELGVVPFPVGPSGDAETNKGYNATTGNNYLIPAGVEDPAFVYTVFADYMTWYGDDLELRDDVEWFENQMISEENFNMLLSLGEAGGEFDLWGKLNVSTFDMVGLINGEKTPAQVQEESKQVFQDALDAFFK